MTTINIGKTDDVFYRYKRHISLLEHKSGKTIITNLSTICADLNTKPSYFLYYIQLEKSIPVTNKGEIKTIIKQAEIELLINNFIDKYILCAKCKYPELEIKKSNKNLYFSCKACGNVIDIIENKFTKIIYKDYAT